MSPVLRISFRNLIRQRRRNILLGIAIAFGTMILIIANSFSSGLTDIIFTRTIKAQYGHISLSSYRNGNIFAQIFPDSARIWGVVTGTLPEVSSMKETLRILGRAISSTKADGAFLDGFDITTKMSENERKEFQSDFSVLEGSFESLGDTSISHPVAVSEDRAKHFKVKIGDILRVRFLDVNNRQQAAELTVVCIFKPASFFMYSAVFLNIRDLKRLAGCGPNQSGAVQMTIPNPKRDAVRLADKLHHALKPGLAVIPGSFTSKTARAGGIALSFRGDTSLLRTLTHAVPLSAGDSAKAYGYQGVIAAAALARELQATVGDTVTLTYQSRIDTTLAALRCAISGIAAPGASIPENAFLINERDFYQRYYSPLPRVDSATLASLPDSANSLFAALGPEYLLLKRSHTSEEAIRAFGEIGKVKFKGLAVDVGSMYETASMVIQLETALNLITFVAVMLLFLVILVGVVNTLRMAIRERTREIGTVRAIGMQARDVRSSLLLETWFLAFFSSLAGIAAAFLVMWVISAVPIRAGDSPITMILDGGHLHFRPSAIAIVGYTCFIWLVTVGAAFFPARRAARMSAAAALRHYE